MRVFRSDGGPVPDVSQHTSRPSMEQIRQKIIEEMQTPTTNEDAWKHALLRDGYRCTLTGIYDFDSCKKMPDLAAECATNNASMFTIQCAHIFSESALDGHKTDYTASAMALLRMFGLTNEAEILVGGNVNRHFNIFLVVDGLHHFYNRLEFWLEEVFGEEVSNVLFWSYHSSCPYSQTRTKYAPPTPPSLTLLQFLPEISVMAEDGGTAELLTSRLLQFPSVRVGISSRRLVYWLILNVTGRGGATYP
ncbi:hypothetical protein C8F01DRAFT_264117 [Mycena amicta]|nr:hypothetical protein C8F01DRAFT_264117 [Mycena amicta]